MLGTPALHQLVDLADRNGWRLALVGDPRQLQGVGRGGLFAELCANGRVARARPPPPLHRAVGSGRVPAAATPATRDALDAYEAHGRIVAGTARRPPRPHRRRLDRPHDRAAASVAIIASTNDHVDAINHAIQARPPHAGHLDADGAVAIAGGEHAHLGDVVATRRNDRHLATTDR